MAGQKTQEDEKKFFTMDAVHHPLCSKFVGGIGMALSNYSEHEATLDFECFPETVKNYFVLNEIEYMDFKQWTNYVDNCLVMVDEDFHESLWNYMVELQEEIDSKGVKRKRESEIVDLTREELPSSPSKKVKLCKVHIPEATLPVLDFSTVNQ
jgi:hypothetical protein